MNQSVPAISVITVTRNDLSGLRRTIASTAAQTYSRIEQIVVDGASTDGTLRWLKGVDVGHELQFRSEPDKGIYDAMNKGIRRSSGDIVIFMNSGDVFTDENVLAEVAESWLALDWDWAYGGIRFVDGDGHASAAYFHAPFARRRFHLGLRYVPHQATFITRRLLDQSLAEFDETFGVSGDQEMAMRASVAADPHVFVRFVADFLEGGEHSKSSDRARELRWHRMRKKNGLLLANSRILDRVYSETLAAQRGIRRVIRKRARDR